MEDLNQLKVYTVEEANRLIGRLTPLLEELRVKRDLIVTKEVEIDAQELIAGRADGGVSPALDKKVEEYHRLVDRFYHVVDEIHSLGCLLKDVDMGLIDFYSMQQGKLVYLCWKLGEPEVRYRHEIGQGYTHREPLP